MWGKGRLAEMTQTYLGEYFPTKRAKLYKELLTADKEEVFEILAMIKAINSLEVTLERDYKSGVIALEEIENENTED